MRDRASAARRASGPGPPSGSRRSWSAGCRWCRMGADSRAAWMEAVLAAARDAGCPAAEIFVKEGHARQITIEPSSGDAPGRHISRTQEAGAALQIVDPARRPGFAWANLGDSVDPAALIG